MTTPNQSVDALIVGAGISALVAAQHLQRAGRKVLLVEKSRGVGGRMATRRLEEARFDHGCQFFTARSQVFAGLVGEWLRENLVKVHFTGWDREGWAVDDPADGHPRYVVPGGMTAVAKHLAKNLDIRTGVEVTRLQRISRGWAMADEEGNWYEGRQLLATAPVPQTLQLLGRGGVMLPESLSRDWAGIGYEPCFSLMVQVDQALNLPGKGFRKFSEGILDCIFDNHGKGVSGVPGALTIQSTGTFAEEYFAADPKMVVELLWQAARPFLGGAQKTGESLRRWKYAKPRAVRWDLFGEWRGAGLYLAGDAFGEAKVEGAVRSGWAAAEAMIRAWSGPDSGLN